MIHDKRLICDYDGFAVFIFILMGVKYGGKEGN